MSAFFIAMGSTVKPTVASVASQLASLCTKFDLMKEEFDEMKAENSNLNSTLTSKCEEIVYLTAGVSNFQKKSFFAGKLSR